MKCKSTALLGLSVAIVVLFVVGEPLLQNVSGDCKTIENGFRDNIREETSAGSYHQNLTITGDFIVENGTYLIENMELHLAGKMIARNDATVRIKNAKLVVTTRGETIYRDGVVLLDRSRFITENATLVLNSTHPGEESYITVDNEALVNITDSELYGNAFIICRQSSKTYVTNSSLSGPKPIDSEVFGVITEDNSTARIEDSQLDCVGARGHSSIYVLNSITQTNGVSGSGDASIEIENSDVGAAQWFFDNCTLRVSNSAVYAIGFSGSVLHVEDSSIGGVWVYEHSTTWLKSTSVNTVQAYDRSQVWLIDSAAKEIKTLDEGKVYVGWQLLFFGTISFPYTWLPILQGLAFLAAVSLAVALLFFLNRRWKRWQLKKLR